MTARALRPIAVVRVGPGARASSADVAVAEEPMAIRLNGDPFAVIMRTPGADRELAAGFLLSEHVITGSDDLGNIVYCTEAETAGLQNVLDVQIVGDAVARLPTMLAERRQVTTNSSCGLCGRKTIESLREQAPRVTASWTVSADAVRAWPVTLRAAQTVFDETGGLHAAGLFDARGTIVTLAEDVGRHNAVDKVVGRMLLMDRLPLAGCALVVSGRTSYEIVQKAFVAGIPIVASVSAPSGLAIDLAEDAGITLVGFVRGETFNIYAHPERIA